MSTKIKPTNEGTFHFFFLCLDEMKQDSVNDQLMASSVKDEQILSKHSIEYLPQSRFVWISV